MFIVTKRLNPGSVEKNIDEDQFRVETIADAKWGARRLRRKGHLASWRTVPTTIADIEWDEFVTRSIGGA
jgi:hypothetical protein